MIWTIKILEHKSKIFILYEKTEWKCSETLLGFKKESTAHLSYESIRDESAIVVSNLLRFIIQDNKYKEYPKW